MTTPLSGRNRNPGAVGPIALAIALSLITAACGAGAEPPPPPADPEPILAVAEIGGCAMMGPNCVTRLLWSDGAVTAYRGLQFAEPTLALVAGLTPEGRAGVDVAVVTDLLAALDGTDWQSVVDGLPQGTCHACVDGVDLIVVIATPEGEVAINSAATELDTSVPEIAALSDAAATMSRSISLPIQSR